MSHELLKQVRVLDPIQRTDEIADVLIADGLIQAIAPQLSNWPEETEVRDCQGFVLGPGLVDLYSHSGEPGYEERETLETLLNAATAGGFSRITILPNTTPAVDTPASLTWFQQQLTVLKTRSKSLPGLGVWGSLTQGSEGKQMTELGELATSGIIGFAEDQPLQNLALLRRVLEYLKPLQKPVALYPCDRQLRGNGVMREGYDSIRSGLPGVPVYAETAALSAILELVAATRTPVHIMRVSTARSVELIRDAKQRNLPITASTTWMHILLNTEAIRGVWSPELTPEDVATTPYDPNLHLEPPLGNPSDQTALIQGLQDGVLDAIAIDHTPYTYEEKTVAFADSPPGAIGLELALPLLWQMFVTSGQWSALDLWRCLSTQPLTCLGQTPPTVKPDHLAELTLFDPQQQWTVNSDTLYSRSLNTPWFGQQLTGRVIKTWCPA